MNQVNREEFMKKIHEIELLTEKVKTSLENMNQLIEDNINTGKGIWDGEASSEYKEEWRKIAEEIPTVIDTFEKQNKNLLNMIEITQKVEENE